ncbi:unnamed protein product [Toxocara canis]|uniref:Kinesin motor domain-containing protein n=1 Tax=Toxocara canis TaxID=6265 RepID=A0A183U2F3_TOXCA|nr:unnamed protein product [Toxocara canis]
MKQAICPGILEQATETTIKESIPLERYAPQSDFYTPKNQKNEQFQSSNPDPQNSKRLIQITLVRRRSLDITHSSDQEGLELLRRVLVYNPGDRLYGPAFLADPYFDELFDPRTTRNGKILDTVTPQDKEDALNGDEGDSGSVSLHASETFNSNWGRRHVSRKMSKIRETKRGIVDVVFEQRTDLMLVGEQLTQS